MIVSTDLRLREAMGAVTAALQSNKLQDAKTLACAALKDGLEHALLLNLRALRLEDEGRFEEALVDLRRAHLLSPSDYAILNACGLCLGRLERLEEALQCFDRVVELGPTFGPGWFNRGWALERLGETAKAALSYLKAAEIHPQNAQAWANLAWLSARRADAADTQRYAKEALALQPGHPTAILALAQTEMADPAVAERRVRGLFADALLGPYDRGLAFGQLGDALDAQDRTEEAFAAYSECNAVFRAEARPKFEAEGQATVAATLNWLIPWAEGLDAEAWRAGEEHVHSQAGEASHIFLLGFPRTGTTLIESALGLHPNVVALEERNTLQAAVRTFLADPRAVSRLETIRSRDLQPYRDHYWETVKSFGVDPRGKIFIDKNPFNTIKLPLIYKLFPHARIIFTLRDPRDVVLSCFRRRFNLNASTYELLDLQRAALFYDKTMRFANVLMRKQSMAEYKLVYERLVENFPAEVRAVCAYVGADWGPELLEISSRARRGDVASASSSQIARGLYADGAGQWRRYRKDLLPIADILAPWVQSLGYPEQ